MPSTSWKTTISKNDILLSFTLAEAANPLEMYWKFLALALLPVLGLSSGVPTPLTSFCITTFGTSSIAAVPTTLTSETYTTSFTVTSSTTPTSTVTLPSKKVLVVQTSTKTITTNAVGSTISFTSTLTQFDYSVTVVTAQFTTTTTSTSTSLVVFTPTATPPAGFAALGDAINASGHTANTGPLPGEFNIQKRQYDSSSVPIVPSSAPTSTPTGQPIASSFPMGVICNEILQTAVTSTVVRTARAKTITAPLGTITSTSTRWITKTSTIKPKSAKTTVTTTLAVTFPITTTWSTTSTSTISTTTTTFSAAPTVYPACTGNNYVSGVDGNEVWGLGFEEGSQSGTFWFGFSGYTPESCCIACWLTDTCGAAWWEGNIGGITTATGGCIGIANNPATCSTTQIAAQFGTGGTGTCAVPVMLINSNCGQWQFEGLNWRGPNSIGTVPSSCGF